MKLIPGLLHVSVSTKYRGHGKKRGFIKGPNWLQMRRDGLSLIVCWNNGHWN